MADGGRAGFDPLDDRIARLFFDPSVSDRRLRLFSAACARPVLAHLRPSAPLAIRLVEMIEAFADGGVPLGALAQARDALWEQWDEWQAGRPDATAASDDDIGLWAVALSGLNAASAGSWAAEGRDNPASRDRRRGSYHYGFTRPFACAAAAEATAALTEAANWRAGVQAEVGRHQEAVFADIFGHAFHSVAFCPAWGTDTAVALARQMYESRDFAAMPILADALQDAGCDDEGVLGHCRDANATHCRGCWVVDLVLGKV